MIGAVHLCYLFTFDQKLQFDAGSVIFTVGKTVTGATSKATGTVKSLTVSTGVWGSGTATGYLILSNVSGTFQNDETITDNGTSPGAAVANGANITYVDSYGKKTQTAMSTATSCRFVNLKAPEGNTQYGWSGRFPAVLLPPGTTISDGQRVSSTETGFTGTYEIQYPPVYYPDANGDVHHITCALKAVT